MHATARVGTLELIVKDGKMPNNQNLKKAVPNLDIDRLMEAVSDMPCDNCDDPELVAENERLANESWEEIGYISRAPAKSSLSQVRSTVRPTTSANVINMRKAPLRKV